MFKSFLSILFIFFSFTSITLLSDERYPTDISQSEKATSFGIKAHAYAKGRRGHSPLAYEILKSYVDSEKSVLDIGCGTGISTLPLLELFHEVRGCDIDSRLLEVAIQKNPTIFDLADAHHLPYSNETFDVVTAFSSFVWFCDNQAAKEIYRTLKPSGYFYIVNKNYLNSSLQKKIAQIIQQAIDTRFEHNNKTYHPYEMLRANGFEIVEVEEFSDTESFTVEEAIYNTQSQSYWLHVIKANKEEDTTAILQAYFESIKDKDGKIHVHFKPTCILAKKN